MGRWGNLEVGKVKVSLDKGEAKVFDFYREINVGSV